MRFFGGCAEHIKIPFRTASTVSIIFPIDEMSVDFKNQ